MLVQSGEPSNRRGVHLIFSGQKVRSEDLEPAPELGICCRAGDLSLTPLADLVRMKLVSFRIKDEMHLKDLDEAGLIPEEVVADLPPALTERLVRMRGSRQSSTFLTSRDARVKCAAAYAG